MGMGVERVGTVSERVSLVYPLDLTRQPREDSIEFQESHNG